jgi:hypothetical protein
MKLAGVQSSSRDELFVPARIVIVSLMQAAELERQELFGGTCGRIAELGRELIDLVHDAGSWRPFGGWNSRREGLMAKTGLGKVGLGWATSISTKCHSRVAS